MDYREVLSHSFQQKRRSNPRYSLRAFARDIAISPSRLSEIMTGKGDLSREKAAIIAKRLRMSAMSTANFLDQVDAVVAPQPHERAAALKRVQKREVSNQRRRLDDQSFKVIAEPLYVLIWSLMLLPSYDGDPETIAKHLKCNHIEVFTVLNRLEQLSLVRREGGRWFGIKGRFTAGNQAPSESIRAYHRQMSTLGRKSIDSQTMSVRHLDSAVIPFDSQRLGEVQQRITEFTLALIDEFGDDPTCDSVYGLSQQFFRMAEPLPESKTLN